MTRSFATGSSGDVKMCEWRFQSLHGHSEFDDTVVGAILDVFRDGFDLPDGWSIESVRKDLNSSSVVGLLFSPDDKLQGYAFYFAPSVPLDGAHLLWENAICLRKEVQGKGYTKSVLQNASNVLHAMTFGWVGGRTQNPVVIKRYSKLGRIFPFDASYETGEGKIVMSYLLKHVEQVGASSIDLTNGICRRAYRYGQLGNYPTDVVGTERFETQLQNWNFRRDEGDAVAVVSRLRYPLRATI